MSDRLPNQCEHMAGGRWDVDCKDCTAFRERKITLRPVSHAEEYAAFNQRKPALEFPDSEDIKDIGDLIKVFGSLRRVMHHYWRHMLPWRYERIIEDVISPDRIIGMKPLG